MQRFGEPLVRGIEQRDIKKLPQCFVCKQKAIYVYTCECGVSNLCGKKCHTVLHEKKYYIELAKVRTRELGLSSTLSIGEWLWAIRYFHWKCAYCQDASVNSIDHFVPVSFGGGTDAENCIPCCLACNKKKANLFAGDSIAYMFGVDAQRRVQAFIAERRAYQSTKGTEKFLEALTTR